MSLQFYHFLKIVIVNPKFAVKTYILIYNDTTVAQLIVCCPIKQLVASSVLSQGTLLGWGFGLCWGSYDKHQMFVFHIIASLPLLLSPFFF